MVPLRRLVRVARVALVGTGIAAAAACGGSGSGSASDPAAPLAAASANVATGQAPLAVNFNASGSSDPQGYALTYSWAFGDGSSATGAVVSHTFEDHGQYPVTVTVSDGHLAATAAMPISVTAAPPVLGPMTMNVGVLGVATTVTQATVPASDRENLPLTYTLLSQPALGSATIDATTGVVTYTVSGYPTQSSDQFTVQVANLEASTSGTVAVALNSDPLLPNQWHIQNTGTTAFASTLPVAGNDLDVAGAWAEGYTGQNIKVGIIDRDRVVGGAPFSADNDVFNASFETDNYSLPQPDPTAQAILLSTSTLRSALGAAVVHAAGNDFQLWESEYEKDPGTAEALCSDADYHGVSCGDTASDPDRTSPVPIIVGALDAAGTHASYSDTGAALWISAPAGEFGINSGYVAGLNAATAYMPGIITTARPGCANATYPPSYSGFSVPDGVNPLDANGANPLAADCQYTATMSGTSAATPMVSAVIALMLQANPKLSVRDIKYILARTARHVDPTFAGVSADGITFDAGWVRNAAGFSFSNCHGFGGVHATAAVNDVLRAGAADLAFRYDFDPAACRQRLW